MNTRDQNKRICTKCGIEKPLEDFHIVNNRYVAKTPRGGKAEYRTRACKKCLNTKIREYVKTRKKQDPDFAKKYNKGAAVRNRRSYRKRTGKEKNA